MSLTEAIKQEIGYTEAPAEACKNCKYHKEEDNPHDDRAWISKCHIAGNVIIIRVSPNGRCSKFNQAV